MSTRVPRHSSFFVPPELWAQAHSQTARAFRRPREAGLSHSRASSRTTQVSAAESKVCPVAQSLPPTGHSPGRKGLGRKGRRGGACHSKSPNRDVTVPGACTTGGGSQRAPPSSANSPPPSQQLLRPRAPFTRGGHTWDRTSGLGSSGASGRGGGSGAEPNARSRGPRGADCAERD